MRLLADGRSVRLVVAAIVLGSVGVGVNTASAGGQQQSPLYVTSTSGTFGTALSLMTSGGSGTGALTFGVTNGTASGCAVSGSSLTSSSVGTCMVTATKASDHTYKSVSSSPTTVTLASATSATSLAGSPASPLVAGTSVTLSASISELGGTNATGTINFELAGASISGCSAQALSAGTTTCVVTSLASGSSAFTAVYSGDANYLASTSSTLNYSGLAAQATLNLTSTSGTFGTALTLTTSGGSGTGAITYSASNGTASGCAVSGTSLTSSSVGTCLVTATKGSDATYAPVSSSPTAVTLTKTMSSITMTGTPQSPQNPGTSVTLTASVTVVGGTRATGTMNFELAGTTISGCSAQTLSAGAATCVVSSLASGSNAFTAIYSGDANYLAATSSTFTFVGLTAQAALSVTSTSGTVGVALALTTSGGSGTGAVTYSATNGTASGCAVSGSSLTSSSVGTCIVTATKAGDGMYQPISSSATTVTFALISPSTTTLSASPTSPQSPGTSITLTATVTTGATGSVNFELNGTSLPGCSAVILSSSVATCTTTALVAGSNSFVAIYAGNSSFTGSTSSPLNYTGLTPGAPQNVTATAENGNAKVSWAAPQLVPGVTVVGYTATAVSGATVEGTCVVAVWSVSVLSCTIPDLPLGTTLTFSVTASSATATGPSTSATGSLTLGLSSSAVTLNVSQPPTQNIGAPVTMTATVTPGATGTVSFDTVVSGIATAIPGCATQAVSAGIATCRTSLSTAGSYWFEAIYSGDTLASGLSNYSGSTSSTVPFTISATTLAASTSPLVIVQTAGPFGTAIDCRPREAAGPERSATASRTDRRRAARSTSPVCRRPRQELVSWLQPRPVTPPRTSVSTQTSQPSTSTGTTKPRTKRPGLPIPVRAARPVRVRSATRSLPRPMATTAPMAEAMGVVNARTS
jgi:hypothetical protein